MFVMEAFASAYRCLYAQGDRVLLLHLYQTNNSAHFVRSKENKELPIADREAIGDATETAMLRYTQAYTDIDELRTQLPPAVEVPFNSDKKWSAGVYSKQHASGVYTVYLKVSQYY